MADASDAHVRASVVREIRNALSRALGTTALDLFIAICRAMFVGNLCAILVFSSAFFWIVGFDPLRADAMAPPPTEGGLARVLARRVQRRFQCRSGWWWRLALPVVLLGAVFVPLQAALTEVSWQVRTRAAIGRLIAGTPQLGDALTLQTRVERGAVNLSLTALAVPVVGVEVGGGDADTWAAAAAPILQTLSLVPEAVGCVESPRLPAHPTSRDLTMAGMVRRWQDQLGTSRIVAIDGQSWRLRFSRTPCPAATPAR